MHNTAWDEIDSIHKQLLYSLYTIVTGMHWVVKCSRYLSQLYCYQRFYYVIEKICYFINL